MTDEIERARAIAARCPTVALLWWHAWLVRRAGRRRITRAEAARLLGVRAGLAERGAW